MNKRTIVINGDNFSDLSSFYEEMNRLFMKDVDWKLGHSLDALSDILYGGFGIYDPNEPVLVIWQHFSKSRNDLGIEETKKNYQMKIDKGYPFNIQLFRDRLMELEGGKGPTLCDIIVDIFKDHKNIELQFED